MAAPTPKPKQTPEDLAEVERALSVLHGRHPDHERVRREDEERRAHRKAALDAQSTLEARRVRARRALVGAGIAAVGVVALAGGVLLRDELARRGRIEETTAPYRALGFTLVETSRRGEPSTIEANVPAGCLLVASPTNGAKVRLAHAGGAVEGPAPLLTCLCEGGRVAVSADSKGGVGLALLSTKASTLGGSRAFAFLPFEPGTTGQSDQACAEGALDTWLDEKRWTQQARAGAARPLAPDASVDAAESARWLAADPKRAALRDAGFELRALVKPEAPFALVEVPAESCVFLAVEAPGDKPTLRMKGGSLAVGPAAGNAAWCTSAEASVLAQREGAGELAVLIAPAARVGGLAGVREMTARARMTLGAATVPPRDRGWSAKQVLLASAIPESLITVADAPDLGGDPEARVVAVSVERPKTLIAETPPDVFSFCEPQLGTTSATVCAFSGPQKWRVDGADVVAGVARAKHPFWLFGLQSVTEPMALKRETQLVDLARRLRREGFEPTTIDGVTELDKGVEILGRADEDAIVALALAPTAPWVFPYSDRLGAPWNLEGEPRIIPIKPLERVVLTATTKTLPPKATRRTVVFRRQHR